MMSKKIVFGKSWCKWLLMHIVLRVENMWLVYIAIVFSRLVKCFHPVFELIHPTLLMALRIQKSKLHFFFSLYLLESLHILKINLFLLILLHHWPIHSCMFFFLSFRWKSSSSSCWVNNVFLWCSLIFCFIFSHDNMLFVFVTLFHLNQRWKGTLFSFFDCEPLLFVLKLLFLESLRLFCVFNPLRSRDVVPCLNKIPIYLRLSKSSLWSNTKLMLSKLLSAEFVVCVRTIWSSWVLRRSSLTSVHPKHFIPMPSSLWCSWLTPTSGLVAQHTLAVLIIWYLRNAVKPPPSIRVTVSSSWLTWASANSTTYACSTESFRFVLVKNSGALWHVLQRSHLRSKFILSRCKLIHFIIIIKI